MHVSAYELHAVKLLQLDSELTFLLPNSPAKWKAVLSASRADVQRLAPHASSPEARGLVISAEQQCFLNVICLTKTYTTSCILYLYCFRLRGTGTIFIWQNNFVRIYLIFASACIMQPISVLRWWIRLINIWYPTRTHCGQKKTSVKAALYILAHGSSEISSCFSIVRPHSRNKSFGKWARWRNRTTSGSSKCCNC